MADNLAKVQAAFPLVEVTKIADMKQYENIAYTMPDYLPDMVENAAREAGMKIKPDKGRGGSTSAMMVAAFPDAMPGGVGLYSGQQGIHSIYEWCCIEELMQLVDVTENLITLIVNMK